MSSLGDTGFYFTNFITMKLPITTTLAFVAGAASGAYMYDDCMRDLNEKRRESLIEAHQETLEALEDKNYFMKELKTCRDDIMVVGQGFLDAKAGELHYLMEANDLQQELLDLTIEATNCERAQTELTQDLTLQTQWLADRERELLSCYDYADSLELQRSAAMEFGNTVYDNCTYLDAEIDRLPKWQQNLVNRWVVRAFER
jgi:hypothetical protein